MLILCTCSEPSAGTFGRPDDLNPAAAFDGDDDEEEFEEDAGITGTDGGAGFKDFTFTFSHDLSWATKDPDPGIVTNRSSFRCEFDKSFWDNLFIKFDGKAYLYFENDHIAEAGGKDAVVDEEIREFYIQAGFDRFMVRAGKQVVVWGETDGGVINDVVSPRDESEFIFMDLEEARLGQYMASLDLYSDYGDFLFFVALKPGSNETPDRGTRYYRGFGETVVREEKAGFSDHEAGLKWKKIYDKFEISLMTASLLQNAGVLVHDTGNVYNKIYDRYGFYAVGASYTVGSYLFKIDAAFKHDYSLQSKENDYQFGKKVSDISDTSFAVEYDANGRYTVNLELTNRHVFDYSNDLWGAERDNTSLYFQYNKKFLNDTLEFEYVLYHQFQDKNSFHKAELDYSFSDDVQLTIEYVFFQEGDEGGSLWHYRNEDRIGAELKIYY
ncbi:MAG: hypothetical protein GY737_25175 [Desulfobacteraceae bacterium]|nr:hypothetical protein [Desulfobacteraceae bacterium]